jgi:hypothetical protein
VVIPAGAPKGTKRKDINTVNGNNQLARQDQATTIEQVLIGGDLKALQPADRVA